MCVSIEVDTKGHVCSSVTHVYVFAPGCVYVHQVAQVPIGPWTGSLGTRVTGGCKVPVNGTPGLCKNSKHFYPPRQLSSLKLYF